MKIREKVENSWARIAPSWPIQNVIACNPMQGFENMHFEEALRIGASFFKNENMPSELEKINRITIKWCQVFFDSGQATIKMPNRSQGFFKSWKKLAIYDFDLHGDDEEKINFIKKLPNDSNDAISVILAYLKISKTSEENFMTAMLTSLAGWSAYVRYLGQWSYNKNPEIESDFLAIKMAITAIIWPAAEYKLLEMVKSSNSEDGARKQMDEILSNESNHRITLFHEIEKNLKTASSPKKNYVAQLVFCIDVRSEPFRKELESCGNYETFGFAGFFGIPTSIANDLSGETYASCPVLLSPKHVVKQNPLCQEKHNQKRINGYSTILEIKKFYQSLKYNFITPLPLAEGIGIWSGGWMFVRTFAPVGRKFLQKKIGNVFKQNLDSSPDIESIPFLDQCNYATGALRAIGLVENFAEIVMFCGHGSQTENNSYATALDCGACGGRHGDNNAKILAKIINQEKVRDYLRKSGIDIPKATRFIAAKHNTTTDEIEIYQENESHDPILDNLKRDFAKSQKLNNQRRAKEMGFKGAKNQIPDFFFKRSHNWSETQPEWGLARNASFVVAPRSLTKNIDLKGRSFLHSYDWKIDEDGSILNLIMNAPMIVAQWINSQYLFSTIDNVAFGSGSKITQNIVGKIGVMQGNGSDLMNGLPLQSVNFSDEKKYHKPARLTSLIYAPSSKIDEVIRVSPKLQQLVNGEWIKIFCLDPIKNKICELYRDFSWR